MAFGRNVLPQFANLAPGMQLNLRNQGSGGAIPKAVSLPMQPKDEQSQKVSPEQLGGIVGMLGNMKDQYDSKQNMEQAGQLAANQSMQGWNPMSNTAQQPQPLAGMNLGGMGAGMPDTGQMNHEAAFDNLQGLQPGIAQPGASFQNQNPSMWQSLLGFLG